MKFSKGFTLIELLVVIAIIGILSSVVLASLSTARSKGSDAKVEEQLSGLRSAAEIYYSTNNAYAATSTVTAGSPLAATSGTFLGDTTSGAAGIVAGILGTSGVGTSHAYVASSSWAVGVTLPSGSGAWCVDSTGASKSGTVAAIITASITACP